MRQSLLTLRLTLVSVAKRAALWSNVASTVSWWTPWFLTASSIRQIVARDVRLTVEEAAGETCIPYAKCNSQSLLCVGRASIRQITIGIHQQTRQGIEGDTHMMGMALKSPLASLSDVSRRAIVKDSWCSWRGGRQSEKCDDSSNCSSSFVDWAKIRYRQQDITRGTRVGGNVTCCNCADPCRATAEIDRATCSVSDQTDRSSCLWMAACLQTEMCCGKFEGPIFCH